MRYTALCIKTDANVDKTTTQKKHTLMLLKKQMIDIL